MASSNTSRRPEDYAVSVQDIEITKWLRLIEAATEAIYQIEDPRLQDVLELYYIQCLSWEDVASTMGYSFSHVARYLHPKALNAFKQPNIKQQ